MGVEEEVRVKEVRVKGVRSEEWKEKRKDEKKSRRRREKKRRKEKKQSFVLIFVFVLLVSTFSLYRYFSLITMITAI